MTRLNYLALRLSDNVGWCESTLRCLARFVGVNPWAIDFYATLARAREHESAPVSRFVWGSPCRFVRSIDLSIHVVLPATLEECHPAWATYLRTTSPRWGRTWRHW